MRVQRTQIKCNLNDIIIIIIILAISIISISIFICVIIYYPVDPHSQNPDH